MVSPLQPHTVEREEKRVIGQGKERRVSNILSSFLDERHLTACFLWPLRAKQSDEEKHQIGRFQNF